MRVGTWLERMPPGAGRHPRSARARLRESTDAIRGLSRMEARRRRRSFALTHPPRSHREHHHHRRRRLGTIRGRDRLRTPTGRRVGRDVVVANAYPYSDVPSRAANETYRDALRRRCARDRRARMRDRLEGVPDERRRSGSSPIRRPRTRCTTSRSRARRAGRRRLDAHRPRRTRAARQHRRATAARLAVRGRGRSQGLPRARRRPIRRIGVAYNATEEAKAALHAAADLARALGAELEIIGVISPDRTGPPR